jgi:hypothetical protein
MSDPNITVRSTCSDTAQRMERKRQQVENHAVACADRALDRQRATDEQKARRKALKQAKRTAA